jgi:phosphoribosyl 1,2-cyclic phosphodiesterase
MKRLPRHDSEPTLGFRIRGAAGLFHEPWSLGYAADLGHASSELLNHFKGAQLLALEFNHDEAMERNSGRPIHLIRRVLGDRGHLSNRQAAEALSAFLKGDSAKSLRHLVQLHLSRQCNLPSLAQGSAIDAIRSSGQRVEVHTACQDRATRLIDIV